MQSKSPQTRDPVGPSLTYERYELTTHRFLDGDWVPYEIVRTRGKESTVPVSAVYETTADEGVDSKRKQSRRLRKLSFINVTTTLGLVPVRISKTYIDPSIENDLKACSLFSELEYHSREVLVNDARLRRIMTEITDGFPISVQGSEPTNPQASIWKFENSKRLFVSFRGDHNASQIFWSLGLVPQSSHLLEGNKVNELFMKCNMQIIPCIIGALSEISPEFDEIILTGHGLGGSLASLAAPILGESFPNQLISCYTFGASKVGDEDFKKSFQKRVHRAVRVIISGDPLPHLPTCADQFVHAVDATCITKSGYIEKWPASTRTSPQVTSGIEKIDFDLLRWERVASKYRTRVHAAFNRQRSNKSSKLYVIAGRTRGL